MPQPSLLTTLKPNVGRVYDYFLGGSHNFAVDRQLAELIKKVIPYIIPVVRLQRWCLQDLALELTQKHGLEILIDFGSGLPTNDHIHHVVSDGTKVIYSDSDPVAVEYSREILRKSISAYCSPGSRMRKVTSRSWTGIA